MQNIRTHSVPSCCLATIETCFKNTGNTKTCLTHILCEENRKKQHTHDRKKGFSTQTPLVQHQTWRSSQQQRLRCRVGSCHLIDWRKVCSQLPEAIEMQKPLSTLTTRCHWLPAAADSPPPTRKGSASLITGGYVRSLRPAIRNDGYTSDSFSTSIIAKRPTWFEIWPPIKISETQRDRVVLILRCQPFFMSRWFRCERKKGQEEPQASASTRIRVSTNTRRNQRNQERIQWFQAHCSILEIVCEEKVPGQLFRWEEQLF